MTRGLYVSFDHLAIERARGHLVAAAHALHMPTSDGKAAALLYAAMALLEIAGTDPEQTALDLAEETVRGLVGR